MKTRFTFFVFAALAAIPMAMFQGCYTQFGSVSKPGEEDAAYVTSDSVSDEAYTDARRQFYIDQSYPYSAGYMESPWYDSWSFGFGTYWPYPGYYGGFYGRYYYPYSYYGYSPWASPWGYSGWYGYSPYSYGSAFARYRPVSVTRTIGSRRTVNTTRTYGSTRAPDAIGGGTSPAPSTVTLPGGARRGTSAAPPVAPAIRPPVSTGRRGYDGERTPPRTTAPAPAPAPTSRETPRGGQRGTERSAPPATVAPSHPSSPPPSSGGTRSGGSRSGGERSGGSRGGNRR
jgi:hypothetical protein